MVRIPRASAAERHEGSTADAVSKMAVIVRKCVLDILRRVIRNGTAKAHEARHALPAVLANPGPVRVIVPRVLRGADVGRKLAVARVVFLTRAAEDGAGPVGAVQ